MSAEESTMLIILEAQDKATTSLDLMERKIKELANTMDRAAASISAASTKIDESMAKTAAESAVVDNAQKDLTKSLGDTGRAADNASKNLDKAGKSAGGAGGGMSGLASKIRLVTLAAGAIAAPISGLLALGPVALFGGMAAAVFSYSNSLKQAQASGTKLTATQKELLPTIQMLVKDFAPAAAAAKGVLTQLLQTFQKMSPVFQQAGAALGPIIKILGSGVIGFLQNFLEPLSNMLTNLQPIVQVLANGLAVLGTGLAGLFQNLNLAQAAQGLNAIFVVVSSILPVLGQFLSALAPISNVIFTTLLPALGQAVTMFGSALMPVIQAITPVIGPLAQTFAVLAGTFGQLLSAVAPLITPILQIVLAFANFDTTLEMLQPLFSALAKVLGPILTIVAQVANVVSNALNDALTKLAVAITPLIPILGQLVETGLNALVQALNMLLPALQPLIPVIAQLAGNELNVFLTLMQALVPIIGPVVAVIVQLLPFVSKLANILIQLTNIALIPMIKFMGQLFHALLPILPPLTQLAGSILNALFQVIIALLPGIQSIVKSFIALLPALIPLIPPLVQILQAIVQLIPPLTPLLVLLAHLVTLLVGPLAVALQYIVGFVALLANIILHILVPVINTLVKGLSDSIKSITKILQGIIDFVDGIFTGNWSKAWKAVKNIFTGFVSDLLKPINDVVLEVGGIVVKVLHAFANAGSWLFQAGKDIISGLWNGISNSVGSLLSNVASVGGSIVSTFTHALGIGSPSRKMADEVGQWIPAGIGQGMLNNLGAITAAAKVLGTHTVTASVASIQTSASALSLGSGGGGGAGGGVTFDMRGSTFLSDKDIDALVQKIGSRLATVILPSGGLRVKM